jgi:anti-sigma factor RsiW
MKEKSEEGFVLCSEPDLVDLFLSYIVGDVEPDERKRIDEHLANCAQCREDMIFFSDLQRVGEERFANK